jgi:hypothetical protein
MKAGEQVGARNRAVVSGRVLTSTASEVGRGLRLGQHGKVGNPIEASWGGVAHQRGALSGGGGSAEELADARLEERRVAPMVGLEGTGESWWSSGWDGDTGRGPEVIGDEKCSGGDSTQRCSTFACAAMTGVDEASEERLGGVDRPF